MKPFEFGIYIHWPYCLAKCPYCDFNSHVRNRIPEEAWINAIRQELQFAASELVPTAAIVTSIFFGGGTPSLMSASAVNAAIDCIVANWTTSPDIEITLETNPSSADSQRFRGYRDAGVNRISIGVQSLDDAALRFLGRTHDSADARRAVALATGAFEHVSVDLIYGRPNQNAATWRAELSEALSFGTEHLSLYQLTIEEGTPFWGQVRAGTLIPLHDESAAELYEQTQAMTERAGVPAYEISNHARPGRECRHNLLYWRYGNYLGVGPGAHGRVGTPGTQLSTITERSPERWLARVAAQGNGFSAFVPVSPEEAAREHLLMNLRLCEGIDQLNYRERWGRTLDGDAVRMLETAGFLEDDGVHLRATAQGRLVLNAIIGKLADAI